MVSPIAGAQAVRRLDTHRVGAVLGVGVAGRRALVCSRERRAVTEVPAVGHARAAVAGIHLGGEVVTWPTGMDIASMETVAASQLQSSAAPSRSARVLKPVSLFTPSRPKAK